MALVSATLFCCEKLLNEDSVFSAIRITDVVACSALPPGVPPEHAYVELTVVGMAKFNVEDKETHTAEIFLIRPDGDKTPIGKKLITDLSQMALIFPVAPRGINIIAQVAVLQKQMGVHYATLHIDNHEVARFVFTLHRVPAQHSENDIEGGV